ncbi:TIGR03617 family F420-dependent LLM class oxidoreductase [Saccharothrix isguenensis]
MSTATGPHAVLLTGATGSLGGHLCAELLTRTPATVYCLVRGSDPAAAQRRLAQRLDQLDDPLGLRERLVAVAGDLRQPRLGLSARGYDALAESVDTILHCGAGVNLAASYDQLAPDNVDGTANMIAFAERGGELTGRTPLFHLVSTLGTLIGARQAGLDDVDERTPHSPALAGHLGYPRSKTAAETVLRTAAERGLPITVMRPGVVTAHSRTGRSSDSDVLLPLLRAAVAIGAEPVSGAAVPADMIDVVAAGIATLATHPRARGHTFHLVRPQHLVLSDLFDALRRAGHRLDPMPPHQWWQRIDEQSSDPAVLPMSALSEVGRYMLAADPLHRPPRISSDATWEVLTDLGFRAPPLDARFLDLFVTGVTAQGLLPSAADPPRSPPALPPTRVDAEPRRSAVGSPAPRTRSATMIGELFNPASFHDCGPGAATAAAACEAAGRDGFWVAERLHDPMLTLAAAASATTTIDIGTCVLVALARSPMTVAASANDLQALSRGRLVLGLGSQIPIHLTHRFGMPADRPAARMRDYVAALRAIWDCWNHDRPLDFRGRFYTHTLMTPYFTPTPNPHGPPRIFLSAAGPRMAELAGEIADGLVAPPFSSRRHLTDLLIPAAARGLAKAGRSRESFTVLCCPLVATDPTEHDHTAAVRRTREQLGMFLSSLTYRPVLELHGLGRLGDQLTAVTLSPGTDKWRRVGDLIDDTTLDLFAITAPPQDLDAALHHRFDGLADRVAPHIPPVTAGTTSTAKPTAI